MMTHAKSAPPSLPLQVGLKALRRPDMGPHVEPLSLAMNQTGENYSGRLSLPLSLFLTLTRPGGRGKKAEGKNKIYAFL